MVQEDRRVFVSFDGYLYFSSLEESDAGNYSCNVQSEVSKTGKNGPLFQLHVVTHCVYSYFYSLYKFILITCSLFFKLTINNLYYRTTSLKLFQKHLLLAKKLDLNVLHLHSKILFYSISCFFIHNSIILYFTIYYIFVTK